MKLPCAVVRDLLPLYAEKLTEQETQLLIEKHMRECPECKEKYTEIGTVSAPAVDTAAPLRTLKKEIGRRKWYVALIAALLVLVIAITFVYHADSLKPVQWEEGLVTVKGIEEINAGDCFDHPYQSIVSSESQSVREYNGEALILKTSSRVKGIETEYIEEDGTVTAILQGFGRSSALSQEASPQGGEIIFCPVPDRLIYGYENPQILLWGEPMNGGVEVLPRLVLTYYVLITVVLAVLSGLLWLLLRKRQRSWIARQLFFAPMSYILAHLLIKGFYATSFFILRDFGYIVLTAIVLYALLSLVWQVWLRQRKNAA